jgi:DNA repair exonuclease SbcCD ATPase subunit
MRAKLIKESLDELTPYGFYDMANSLDMRYAAIPELEEAGIDYKYDGYANFLTINVKNEREAKIAEHILLYSAEGDKAEDDQTDDAAVIIAKVNEDERLRQWTPDEERRTRTSVTMGGGGLKPVTGSTPIKPIRPAKKKTKYYSFKERQKIQDKIDELEYELEDLNQEEQNIRMEMEEDLADYEETTHVPDENPRYSFKKKTIKNPTMPHDVWGDKLNDVEEKKEKVQAKLEKLYQHPAY